MRRCTQSSRIAAASDAAPLRERKRQGPKGRRVDRAGAGRGARSCSATRRASRDLLIEHLHKLQDRFGHLSARATWRRWRRR